MPVRSRVRLLGAFGAGVAAWEAVVHASLLLSGASPAIFGVRLTPRRNLVQTVVPAATALALARFAFARPRPPLPFRIVARRLLRRDLGPAVGDVLHRAEAHYRRLAPKTEMAVTPVGRLEVRIAAYLIALDRAMRDVGVPEGRARALLSAGLFRVMRPAWRIGDRLVPPWLSPIGRARFQVGLARRLAFREPDWAMHEVRSNGRFSIDVTRCVARDLFASEGEGRLCDLVMCEQDVLAADSRGVPFARTQTLARGDLRCDFRFG